VLGGFPDTPRFSWAEITARADTEALKAAHIALSGIRIMRSSDAHRRVDMRPAADWLELGCRNAQEAVRKLFLEKPFEC
jgi:hypothetical protein